MRGFEKNENIVARLPRRNKTEENVKEIKKHIQKCDFSASIVEIASLARTLSHANMSSHQLGFIEQVLLKLSHISSKRSQTYCEP